MSRLLSLRPSVDYKEHIRSPHIMALQTYTHAYNETQMYIAKVRKRKRERGGGSERDRQREIKREGERVCIHQGIPPNYTRHDIAMSCISNKHALHLDPAPRNRHGSRWPDPLSFIVFTLWRCGIPRHAATRQRCAKLRISPLRRFTLRNQRCESRRFAASRCETDAAKLWVSPLRHLTLRAPRCESRRFAASRCESRRFDASRCETDAAKL